jgi:ubiquinone/menaquinone biosynthesis C-methylase UbiE
MGTNSSNPLSRALRKTTKFLWARQTPDHLESMRRFELEFALRSFPDSGKALEVGAGTGWQANALQKSGFDVDAIDLSTSNYKDDRTFPVVDYDGHNIPFADSSFDVVFSSSVMEHIPHIEEFQTEIHRVLKRNGIAIHIVPSSSWRVWTTITRALKSWKIPEIHGEHANNVITETLVFRKKWWRQLFERTGWRVVDMRSCPIFYAGCAIMDKRLNTRTRQRLSKILDGSTSLFLLKENN